MKSLEALLRLLLLDCGRKCGAAVEKDVLTLLSRVKHEGDSFITITLATFCQDFERSLDTGRVAPDFFSFRKEKSGIPSFLKGFLCQVFDNEGLLLKEPSIECIRSIRQICLFGKKILRPCTNARSKAALSRFVECDAEVAVPDSQFRRYYQAVGRVILSSLNLEEDSILESFVPRHGPGATAERISGNQKWRFRTWHRRLTECGIFYTQYAFPLGVAYDSDLLEFPDFPSPEHEAPVRVVCVPKTQKSPRIIAVEPVCMQYAQQGLSRYLVSELNRSGLTGGQINFSDQSVNQRLALTSSRSRHLATIDMSDASDRISLDHVTLLFGSSGILPLIQAARSTRAVLPSGDLVSLKKFASMGSALCFPVEALVFFTSIIASRCLRAGVFPNERHVHSLGRDVYVYGDDLIVPADEASWICHDLETFGFKVNRRKSFWTGKFRESCGSDCYDGEEVTPVYLRRDSPTGPKDVSGIVSAWSTSTQLARAGYSLTATALREAVEACVGHLPCAPQTGSSLVWEDYSMSKPKLRWNKDLQRVEMRAIVPVSTSQEDPLDGYPALAKCYRIIGLSEDINPEHLLRSERPYGLALKRRWVPAPRGLGIGSS